LILHELIRLLRENQFERLDFKNARISNEFHATIVDWLTELSKKS
jgi:hypothetical protein